MLAEPLLLDGDELALVTAEVVDVVRQVGRTKVFLAYQASAIALSHEHELLVIEKSRRIGITWAFAGDDAILAGTAKAEGGDDVLYISYSHDMAREYMDAVAGFAKAFMGVDASVAEFLFDDEDPKRPGETRQIKAFRIDFASGNAVQALSSAPRSLRGKQGHVRIDEAAFVDHLDELLKAALALLIWGGQVTVMSTHDGVDNPFNVLIQAIRAGERSGHVKRITFADALEAGLYERVCLRTGDTPTPEGKIAWEKKIRDLYGAGAAEELDVIPSRGGGAWLTFDEIERAERADAVVVRRAFDQVWAAQPELIRQLDVALWCEREIKPLLLHLDQNAPHGIGGDFARRVDLTVITVMEETQRRDHETRFSVELRNCPLSAQTQILAYILAFLRRWAAQLDAGGLGLGVAEAMQEKFGAQRVTLVHMNAPWWLTVAPPIKSRFEDGRITVARDRDVASDLRGVLVKGGTPYIPENRNRAKGEDAKKGETRHFDSAVATVLASEALRTGVGAPFGALLGGERVTAGFEGPSSGGGSLFEGMPRHDALDGLGGSGPAW